MIIKQIVELWVSFRCKQCFQVAVIRKAKQKKENYCRQAPPSNSTPEASYWHSGQKLHAADLICPGNCKMFLQEPLDRQISPSIYVLPPHLNNFPLLINYVHSLEELLCWQNAGHAWPSNIWKLISQLPLFLTRLLSTAFDSWLVRQH